jgi:hypothetical protein
VEDNVIVAEDDLSVREIGNVLFLGSYDVSTTSGWTRRETIIGHE